MKWSAAACGCLLAIALVACSGPPPLSDRAVAGRQVFLHQADPPCGDCHSLAEAGTSTEIGPELDKLVPSHRQVVEAVTNGVGVMPSQNGVLTPEQIQDLAHYVVEAAAR